MTNATLRSTAHESTLACAVREAVTNVVKRSDARTCHITLESCAGGTVLEVRDDGPGAVSKPLGVGLKGLADRVRARGGVLHVAPAEGEGFTLQVRLVATDSLRFGR